MSEDEVFVMDEDFEKLIRHLLHKNMECMLERSKTKEELYAGVMSLATSLMTSGLSLLPDPYTRIRVLSHVQLKIIDELHNFEHDYESN